MMDRDDLCLMPHASCQDNIARTGVGISEHTDFELITVMHQDSPGLWLKSPGHGAESRWYQPHFRPDVLTVILGVSYNTYLLLIWTNASKRYCTIMFLIPNTTLSS